MNSRNISLVIVLLLAPAALWFWMVYCGNRMLDTDYSTVASTEMFQRVVGMPAPAGLSIVKVAGHHGVGTGMVWMKLDGDKKAFDALTANMVSVGKGFTYTIPSGQFGVQKTFSEDARAASWNEVPNVANPQVYLFNNTAGAGEHWNGTIVISPVAHDAYLSGSLVSGH